MKLQLDTEKLIAKAVKNWDKLKRLGVPKKESYSNYTITETPIGTTHWDNPNLLWLYITSSEEGYYEGSQSQIGLTKDGKLVYQFQSHCSYNSYEDNEDAGIPITADEIKSFNFTYKIPKEWEAIIYFNLKKLLSSK